MIHNKYLGILQHFLRDYKIEIHGRSLVGRVKMSQKAIAIALDDLEKEGILKSRKQGNMKLFSINTKNDNARTVLASLEIMGKMDFLSKHPKLASIFKQDDRIAGIFGSYAEGSQKKSSDVDIFIIGRKRKDDYDQKGALLDIEISIKYFSEKQFKSLLRSKNSLIKEIISKHIILFGAERFVDAIWGDYYGLD